MNFMASIAIVATAPRASLAAMIPPAISIWLKTQPPKIWPLVLISRGWGIVRSTGSPLVVISGFFLQKIFDLLVMACAAGQEGQ